MLNCRHPIEDQVERLARSWLIADAIFALSHLAAGQVPSDAQVRSLEMISECLDDLTGPVESIMLPKLRQGIERSAMEICLDLSEEERVSLRAILNHCDKAELLKAQEMLLRAQGRIEGQIPRPMY